MEVSMISSVQNQSAANKKHILFADFDNTQLLTKEQSAVVTYQNILSNLALQNLSNNGDINLIHCTGRVFSDIHRDIKSGQHSQLPFPTAAQTPHIICGVGTEIYTLNNLGEYELDTQWDKKLKETGFEDAIKSFTVKINGRIISHFCHLIENTLGADINLKPQDDSKNTNLKKSMWGEIKGSDHFTNDELKTAVEKTLHAVCKFEDDQKIEVTTSIQSGKIAIDLTPKGANKHEACMYLAGKLGYTPDEIWAAGDSLNDGHCIHLSGANVIVVGNAQADLIKAIHNENKAAHVNFAKLENEAASGIIECLEHANIITHKAIISAQNEACTKMSDIQNYFVDYPETKSQNPYKHYY